jgi:hypothetical protein
MTITSPLFLKRASQMAALTLAVALCAVTLSPCRELTLDDYLRASENGVILPTDRVSVVVDVERCDAVGDRWKLSSDGCILLSDEYVPVGSQALILTGSFPEIWAVQP